MSAVARTIRCPHCQQNNRVPAAAQGIPRCGNCRRPLPWIADADDASFAEVAQRTTIPVLVDRIEANPRIEVLPHSEVCEVTGDKAVESAVAEDRRTGERRTLPIGALFVFIGARPGTAWLAGTVALDERGAVLTGRDAAPAAEAERRRHLGRAPLMLETSLPGVFAVGDVRSGSIKRVASAVGEGSMSVHQVHEYLREVGRSALDEPRHRNPFATGPTARPAGKA